MEEIKNIIIKNVLGDTLTKEEEKILKEWIESNPSNVLLLEKLKTFELPSIILEVENEGLGSEMANHFSDTIKTIEKKKQRTIFTKIAYTVSAAAVIALSWLLFDYNKRNQDINTLSNHTTITLSNDAVGSIRLITANKVLNLDKEINYLQKNENKLSFNDNDSTTNEEPQIDTLIIPLKRVFNFVLPDGSRVWINSNSKLMFPNEFSDTLRSVELIGEAYFEITKNENAPFIVNTKNLNTRVLGTEFMVSCHEDRNEVSLIEGSVMVNKNGSNKRIVLKPGYGVILSSASAEMEEVKISTEKIVGRKNGFILYDEEKLSDITTDLKHLYGVNFVFENEELKNQTFYIKTTRKDSIQNIMQLLKYTKKIDYTIQNDKIIIKPYRL